MPSLALSEKKKDKKKEKMIDLETPEQVSPMLTLSDSESDESSKKKSKKKDKKKQKSSVEEEEEEEKKKSKKKDKKRKSSADEEEEEKSSKKVKLDIEDNPNSVSNFRISPPLRQKLKEKGIEALFPIQATTFDIVLDGADLVGRARTGQGKTLAFVLPILESLTNGPAKSKRKNGYGRAPSVLVLLPTRELAKQVFADFELYGGSLGLSSCCLYGGDSYQTHMLKKGVDIIVGTPGRIKDHIEKEQIDLSHLQFRVLDEADEMLNMGFVEHVEFILGKVEDASKVQTLLFSATFPSSVKKISSRFLKADKKTIDLVGNDKMKASNSVRHIVLRCSKKGVSKLIPDIISCYSSGGCTIVFTETKGQASDLCGLLPGARALHGDIAQSQREVTLAGFRNGKFSTLVATSVAARGLDINDVQLIIQCEPPRDVESYIHRSGRTGRAGKSGVAVMLYDSNNAGSISKIEREAGIIFERLGAPQPNDIAKAVGMEAAEKILQVCDSVVPAFLAAAKDLLENSGLPAEQLLAKALAKTAGFTEIKKRSLLTSMENHVTLHLKTGRQIHSPSFVYGMLRRFLPEDKVELIQGLALTADGECAVFDVVQTDVDLFTEAVQKSGGTVRLEVVTKLPELKEREPLPPRRYGRNAGGNFGGHGGGGNRFNGGGNRFNGGGGGGRGRGQR